MSSEHWKDEPEDHDYPAAKSYLSLMVSPGEASALSKALKKRREIVRFAAKDIIRAAGLTLLPADDSEVAADIEKGTSGTRLSPVLLVRGVPLWIADGYHRVCASYHIDPKAEVPCRIVDRP